MTPRSILRVGIAALVACGLFMALQLRPPSGAGSAHPPGDGVADPLTAYRGRTVLLVLGMPGCPGTATITAFLSAYAATKPPQVELLRIDVPPPGGTLDRIPWSAPFRRQVDSHRDIANALGFFSYPTFYVIDPDGVIRFTGPFDQATVPAMVAAIAAEKPGCTKRMFSPPMPDTGALAADFTGTTIDGKEVALRDLRGTHATLLFFASTSCPFSRQASHTLPALIRAYGDKGLKVAIINQGEQADAIRDFYAQQGAPVIVDADRTISLGMYGVWAVPFCFVLGGDGTILARQAYTEDGARAAVTKALGLSYDVRLPQAGAG